MACTARLGFIRKTIPAFLLAALLPSQAFAHVGHLGELAGHSHWAGAALLAGAAALAGLGLLKGRKKKQDDAEGETAEETSGVDGEPEAA